MKLIDKIIIAMGHDKVIHLLVGALITMFFGIFGTVASLAGWVVTLILSVIKEYLDDHTDMQDVIYSMAGATVTVMLLLCIEVLG